MDMERRLGRSARLPTQLVDENLLLLRRQILVSKEHDSSLSDEDREISNRNGIAEKSRDLSLLRELCTDGGSEVELGEFGERKGGLERSREGGSGDGHGEARKKERVKVVVGSRKGRKHR